MKGSTDVFPLLIFSRANASGCGNLSWLGVTKTTSTETGTPCLPHDFLFPQFLRLKLLDKYLSNLLIVKIS